MRKDRRLFGCALLVFFCLCYHSAIAAETGGVPVGTTLPAVKLEGPTAEADQQYLGLKGSDPFTLSQVSAKLVIVDFFNSM